MPVMACARPTQVDVGGFMKEQCIVQALCSAGGSLSLSALRVTLYGTNPRHDISLESLRIFLSSASPHNLFKLVRDKRRDDYTVSVRTNAVLCSSYNSKKKSCTDGNACRAFHLCSHFVSDRCKKGTKCYWPHDLHSRHNLTILEQNGLVSLDIKYILLVLRQSWVDITVPDICFHYNIPAGCIKGKKCTFLHVCKFYVQGNCRFSRGNEKECRLSHDIKASQPMKVWNEFHIDALSMSSGDLLKMLHEKLTKASASEDDSDDDTCSEDDSYDDDEEEEDSDQEDVLSSPTQCRSMLSGESYQIHRKRSVSLTVPDICRHYITHTGCNKGTHCKFLHVCKFYVQDNCRFSKGNKKECRLSHDIKASQPMKVWKEYHIDALSISSGELLKMLREKTTKASASKDDCNSDDDEEGDSDQLCEYNLCGKCFYGTKCFNVHSDHPFLWQYKDSSGEWISLTDDSLSIEKEFCKVHLQHCMAKIGHIDFKAMTLTVNGHPYDVRRLETSPATDDSTNDQKIAMTTIWQWYYLDKGSIWVTYDQDVKVEEAYQKYMTTQQDSKFEFETATFRYVLDFSMMEQENLSVGTIRRVRRRPCTVVTRDILQRNLQMQKVMVIIVPECWEYGADADSQKNFTLRLLDTQVHQSEYSRVANLFGQKMNAGNIVKIQRIQNKELLQDFMMKQDRMKKQCGIRSEPKEKPLFHGTQHHVVKAICQQNFDFRISGSRVGAKWGKGSYFSVSAKYSDNYTTSDTRGHHLMFLARVLVGDFTQGNASYGRPPLKDPSKPEGALFDSCVDNIHDPLIFVIFDRVQVYPEYLITYKKA